MSRCTGKVGAFTDGVDHDGRLPIVDQRAQRARRLADLEAAVLAREDPVDLADGGGQRLDAAAEHGVAEGDELVAARRASPCRGPSPRRRRARAARRWRRRRRTWWARSDPGRPPPPPACMRVEAERARAGRTRSSARRCPCRPIRSGVDARASAMPSGAASVGAARGRELPGVGREIVRVGRADEGVRRALRARRSPPRPPWASGPPLRGEEPARDGPRLLVEHGPDGRDARRWARRRRASRRRRRRSSCRSR